MAVQEIGFYTTIGTRPAGYRFAYRFDGLQNLVERSVEGPRSLGILAGTYVYGEGGAGPRQLTSVVSPSGSKTQLTYDAAGRASRRGDATLVYDGFDQLVRVEKGGAVIEHAYGFDGLRVATRDAGGGLRRWFTPGASSAGGKLERSIMAGGRLVAKLKSRPASGDDAAGLVHAGLVLAALGAGFLLSARAPRRRLVLAGPALAAALAACAGPAAPTAWRRSSIAAEVIYFHRGVGAGAVLMTRADASIFEERRYEPFGAAIDAWRETSAGTEVGDVDFRAEAQNSLGKETDPDTGWSYHGARWLAPETAAWLTPDPPVKAPDPAYMAAPWTLHPYQYVSQNPILYWDPDGREQTATKPPAVRVIIVDEMRTPTGDGARTNSNFRNDVRTFVSGVFANLIARNQSAVKPAVQVDVVTKAPNVKDLKSNEFVIYLCDSTDARWAAMKAREHNPAIDAKSAEKAIREQFSLYKENGDKRALPGISFAHSQKGNVTVGFVAIAGPGTDMVPRGYAAGVGRIILHELAHMLTRLADSMHTKSGTGQTLFESPTSKAMRFDAAEDGLSPPGRKPMEEVIFESLTEVPQP